MGSENAAIDAKMEFPQVKPGYADGKKMEVSDWIF